MKRAADTSELMFQRLVEAIVRSELPAGRPLPEARLAREWGVSRTPVREAVRRAASLGLVELRPNQRSVVRKLTSGDVEKLYIVREKLELLAFDLAWNLIGKEAAKLAERAERLLASPGRGAAWSRAALALDEDLHRLWIDRCGNPWLTHAIDNLWLFIRILQRVVAADAACAEDALSEHADILRALVRGDRSETAKALKAHIHSASATLCGKLADT